MSHKCFISFKKEDKYYRDEILKKLGQEDVPVKFLDRWIDSEDADYILQEIRDNYLSDTTVTLFLIGLHSKEDEGVDRFGRDNNFFIKRELQASCGLVLKVKEKRCSLLRLYRIHHHLKLVA